MAFRQRSPVPEASSKAEADFDVMTLRKVRQHPALGPLMERRESLLQRQAAQRQDQRQAAAVLRDFEQGSALALAEEEPGAMDQWAHLKDQLAEADRQLGFIEVAVRALEEQIDAAVPEVHADIEARLNQRRLPLVTQVVAHLAAIEQANRELRGIEGLSQALLHQSRY
jgi:hypothetical protein